MPIRPRNRSRERIVELGEHTLGYDFAVKTDCNDVRERAFRGSGFPTPYIEGFVVLQSTERLDVTSVYTSTAVDDAGNPGPHSSIDVEQIEERGLGVDLQIDKTAAVFPIRIGALPSHAILYTVDVENLGPARATDVRVTDTLTLGLTDTVGVAGVLPQPIELPPGATVESIEQTSLTESTLSLRLGDIAAGTTRTTRFWAIALASAPPNPGQATAVLSNRAMIRSGEAELLDADNTTTVETQLLP